MDKILSGIVKEIAEKYSLDTKEVEMILNMPYKMMRDIIQALELHGKYRGDIQGLKTNFSMPVLFKLYLNEYKLDLINKKTSKDYDREEEDY